MRVGPCNGILRQERNGELSFFVLGKGNDWQGKVWQVRRCMLCRRAERRGTVRQARWYMSRLYKERFGVAGGDSRCMVRPVPAL